MGAGKSLASRSVSLLSLATQLPAVLMDAPVIVRAALTGLLAQPSSKASVCAGATWSASCCAIRPMRC